ncbi:MAG: hypothetical protein QKM86_gp1 [Genomoviridae sp.]|uniref:hypothetical protein n=1 Tax=Genomoviridae sp. TaxID=2202565 RepID=UPI002481C6AD|nr:MAG: hypothetical protein QKM86_gp1 [Genomoviridae sp.]QCW23665.1 MAG: hypothetical protein [Genomoviridae sp.]
MTLYTLAKSQDFHESPHNASNTRQPINAHRYTFRSCQSAPNSLFFASFFQNPQVLYPPPNIPPTQTTPRMSSIPNIVTTRQCPSCNAHFKTKICKVRDNHTNTDAWYVTIEMDREMIKKWFNHDNGIRVPLMYTTLKAQDEVNKQFLDSIMGHQAPEYEV